MRSIDIIRTTLSSFYVGSRLAQPKATSSSSPQVSKDPLTATNEPPEDRKVKDSMSPKKGGDETPDSNSDPSLRRSKRENTWILHEEVSDPTRGRKPLTDVEAEGVRVSLTFLHPFPQPNLLSHAPETPRDRYYDLPCPICNIHGNTRLECHLIQLGFGTM
eukprot:TRINITY_DN1268_c0_g2_i5.p1 TRINITY_DN1268_c0_g2~~TRINITY_DN1268_c0_g2_i5.p1  ORF type:complete len:161 (+),score=26.09 TRINITY_DN1268_c0_g2_i5:340-822(+)